MNPLNNSCPHAHNIPGFVLIPEKDDIPTKLFTWLMKVNIPLIFPFFSKFASGGRLVGPCEHSIPLSFLQPAS